MDVRCERCRAQYVFDDHQVTPSGLTVQCTHCGHVFRVKKKELVVTVPVKPEELDRPPMPATAAAPRAASGGARSAPPLQPEGAHEWRVRQASGNLLTFRELTTLQKWVVEQKVSRDDRISSSGDASWRRLGDIAELAVFFEVVEAAERGRRPPPPASPPSAPMPSPGAAASVPSPPLPAPSVAPPAPPSIEVDLGPDDFVAVGSKSRAGRIALGLVAVAAVAGATYLYVPRLRAEEPTVAEPAAAPLPFDSRTAAGAAVGAPLRDLSAGATDTAGVPGTVDPTADAPAATPAVDGAASAPGPAPDAPPPAPGVAAAEPAAAIALPVPVVTERVAPPPPPDPVAVVAASPPGPSTAAPAPKGLVARATALREQGKVDEALALYGRAIELEPRNVAALTGRGLCYLDLETYPPAEASFEAALGVRPDDAGALLGLAETYRWQGKRANAIRYYERYLAAHPAGEEANVAHNALEELRK